MMPFSKHFDDVYRLLIAPVVASNGLTSLRADEMASPGFIVEQIRTAIQQSRLCIADVTGNNPNVLYELGYAQASGKPLVVMAEEGSQFPFDVAHQRVVIYGEDRDAARIMLQKAISATLSVLRLDEAVRLFELEQYRGAIAAGAVVMEQRLRDTLAALTSDRSSRISLRQMLTAVRTEGLIDESLAERLMTVIKLRNRAVHVVDEPTRKDAEFVIRAIHDALAVLPERRENASLLANSGLQLSSAWDVEP